jgi:FkbM family methyltransferase
MNVYERLRMRYRLLRYRWSDERAELRFLSSRRFAGRGSVLDIGANCGVSSYWLHWCFPNAQVVAFEPQPELVDHLHKFKSAFRLERLHVVPVGLSSTSGTRQMRRPPAHFSCATFDEFCDEDNFSETFNVSATTIDQYVGERPELRPVRFIKCDAAFHEAEVLAGAQRVLREDRPELLVEWSTPRRAYRERLYYLMQGLGYTIFQFEYGRLMPCATAERQSPPSWELGANYLFMPQEAAATLAA